MGTITPKPCPGLCEPSTAGSSWCHLAWTLKEVIKCPTSWLAAEWKLKKKFTRPWPSCCLPLVTASFPGAVTLGSQVPCQVLGSPCSPRPQLTQCQGCKAQSLSTISLQIHSQLSPPPPLQQSTARPWLATKGTPCPHATLVPQQQPLQSQGDLKGISHKYPPDNPNVPLIPQSPLK